MAVKLRVPKKRAENPNSSRDFPEGLWVFEIEDTRLRDIDPTTNPKLDWMFQPNSNGNVRYAGNDAQTISLQLGSAEALEDGQDDPGSQKMFTELTLRDGQTYIDEVDRDNTDGIGYQILVDGALYTNLALALGQAYEEDGYVYPADDFRARLADGEFNGFKVIAKVLHRPWTSQNTGKSGVSVEVEYFSPAA